MPVDDPTTDAASPPPRRRRRVILIVLVALLAAVLVAVLVGQQKLVSKVDRLPGAMPTDASGRPDPDDSKTKTILLLGSDKRADGSIAGQRSDTMMLVRVNADRSNVSLVSIPRDSWVDIPGHGKAKINAAFSWGGTALAVETVEKLSNVRIDHVAVIDWEGFKRLTDTLGGVEITIPEDTYDAYRKKHWKAGTYQMDGAEALTYVRQRAGLAGGDFDRVKRQQHFMRSLMSQTLTVQTRTNPIRLYNVLNAIFSNLTVDEDWSSSQIRSLALSLSTLKGSQVRFTTIPIAGTGMEGAQSVVYIDHDRAAGMWKAFKKDKVAEWIDDNRVNLPKKVD